MGPAPTKPVELEVQEAPLHGEPATMTVGKVVPGSIRAVQPPSEGAVIRELSVMLPAKATPFAGALAWETTIDGKRWRERTKRCEYAAPHHPLAGAGRERLSMSCSPHRDETDPLTPGQAHQVRVRAFLPGTTVDFVAQQPLTLTCPDAATPSAPSSGGCAYGHRPGRSPLWMLLLAGGLVRARGRRRRPPTSRTRSA